MKLLKFFLASVLVFMVMFSNAQTKFGFETGINFSRLSSNSSGYPPEGSKGAFQFGLVTSFLINKHLEVSSKIIYVSKNMTLYTGFENTQISPKYLELPVHAILKASMKGTNFLFIAGPYVAVGFSGQYSGSIQRTLNFGSSVADDLKRYDYGLDLGIGFEKNNVRVTSTFQFGLANLSPTHGSGLTSKALNLNLIVLFGGNKWKEE
ncbi:MAG: PorT family protein [Bacteroidales bacterium]|nr:PorT family protein [Bacteroidales bacterium]